MLYKSVPYEFKRKMHFDNFMNNVHNNIYLTKKMLKMSQFDLFNQLADKVKKSDFFNLG